MTAPSVAIITPIFNRIGHLDRFLTAVKSIRYSNYRLVIVDDGSTDGSSEHLRRHHPEVVLLRGDGNLWWAGATNLGIAWALEQGFDFVLTYNDDQICSPDLLGKLVDFAVRNPDAIVSPPIYYLHERDRLLSGGIRLDPRTGETFGVGNESRAGDLSLPYEVDGVPGYAMLIPAAALRKAGPFDNRRFPQIYMELEFCLRAKRQGFRCLVVPGTSVWNDRGDKVEDPVKSGNPFRRFAWYAGRPKSHLHFGQNFHLAGLLYRQAHGRLHAWPAMRFAVRYFCKLAALSVMDKSAARRFKSRLGLDLDRWA
jgi:GT2 family glycosyltransferase